MWLRMVVGRWAYAQRAGGIPGAPANGHGVLVRLFLIYSRAAPQNSPTMLPSGFTAMCSAAGSFGSPGIVMMSPACATTKPAPADG